MTQQFPRWVYTPESAGRGLSRSSNSHDHDGIIYNSLKVEATQMPHPQMPGLTLAHSLAFKDALLLATV